jgi:hypothetical protein
MAFAASRNDIVWLQRDAPRMDSPARRPRTRFEVPAGYVPRASAPGQVLWSYLGAAVFFIPPGSVNEHLVVDQGIASIEVHWQVEGRIYDHAGDHLKQNLPRGAAGDLLVVPKSHE